MRFVILIVLLSSTLANSFFVVLPHRRMGTPLRSLNDDVEAGILTPIENMKAQELKAELDMRKVRRRSTQSRAYRSFVLTVL